MTDSRIASPLRHPWRRFACAIRRHSPYLLCIEQLDLTLPGRTTHTEYRCQWCGASQDVRS